MRRVAAILFAIFFFTMPSVVSADMSLVMEVPVAPRAESSNVSSAVSKTTLLVSVELVSKVTDDPGEAVKKIMDLARKKLTEHPCMVKAQKEDRILPIEAKFFYSVSSDGQSVTVILEMYSDDC